MRKINEKRTIPTGQGEQKAKNTVKSGGESEQKRGLNNLKT